MASLCGKLFLSSLSTVFSPSLRELGGLGVLGVSRLRVDRRLRGLGPVGRGWKRLFVFWSSLLVRLFGGVRRGVERGLARCIHLMRALPLCW